MKQSLILAAGLALAVATAGAHAQEGQPAAQYSASDFAKSLLADPAPCEAGSEADCEAKGKSRGFSLPTLSAKAVAAHPASSTASPKPGAAKASTPRPKILGGANVLVTFRSGSSDITPQGRANLKSVAEGMKRASLAARKFEVAGYTDPTGSATINMPLSQSRADAVKSFLVGEGVEAGRLSAQGYGSEVLVAPDHPTDERNRRVEIHRLD